MKFEPGTQLVCMLDGEDEDGLPHLSIAGFLERKRNQPAVSALANWCDVIGTHPEIGEPYLVLEVKTRPLVAREKTTVEFVPWEESE